MIDITKKSAPKYFLFGSLYFSEGLEFALATVFIPIILQEKGFSIPIATLIVGIAMIPWTLKFFWGGITDYFIKFGRKRFVIIGGVLSVTTLIILAFIDPATAIIPFTILLFISHSGITFLDVSADAWAIETSKEKERGKINGAMYAGLFMGMAVSSPLLGYVADNYGYTAIFLIASLIVFLTIIFPLVVKEIRKATKRKKIGSLLINEFRKRNKQIIVLFAPISSISAGLIFFVVPLYMKNVLELNKTQIGLISAVFPSMIIIGSIVGGIMADRLGRKKTIYAFLLTSAFFFPFLIFADTWFALTVLYGIVGFLIGGFFSSSCAMLMDITNPDIAATEYSLFTSLFNVGEWTGGTMGGTLIALLGFSRVFLYAGWLIGPAILIFYFVKLKKKLD